MKDGVANSVHSRVYILNKFDKLKLPGHSEKGDGPEIRMLDQETFDESSDDDDYDLDSEEDRIKY